MIEYSEDRFRDMVVQRRIRIGPLRYEFDRRDGYRVLYWNGQDLWCVDNKNKP